MNDLMGRQLAAWPEAARRYRDLQNIETKEIYLDGMPVRAQFNPARAVSTLARTDAAAIKARLAEAFPDMVVFYNGPESGASAPDHFHFQMGCRGFLPVETHFDRLRPVTVMRPGSAVIAVTSAYIPGLPVITAPDGASATAAFLRVLRSLPVSPATGEPQINILCWKNGTDYRIVVIPRKAHRPSCYFAPEDRAVRISPASVDLGGVFIVPVEADFRRTDAEVLQSIIRETVDTSWQPVIDVGLLTAPELRVRFNQPFSISGIRAGLHPSGRNGAVEREMLRENGVQAGFRGKHIYSAPGENRHQLPLGAGGGPDVLRRTDRSSCR